MKFTLIFKQKSLPNYKNQTEFNLQCCYCVKQKVHIRGLPAAPTGRDKPGRIRG